MKRVSVRATKLEFELKDGRWVLIALPQDRAPPAELVRHYFPTEVIPVPRRMSQGQTSCWRGCLVAIIRCAHWSGPSRPQEAAATMQLE